MNFEIELRYELLDQKNLSSFLSLCTFQKTKSILDLYLDTADADLCKKGIYIRIRDHKKIDIKFNRECLADPNLPMQPYCEEYSFALPLKQEELAKFNQINSEIGLKSILTADLEEYKKINQFLDHRIVDKTRSTYSLEEFTIALDEVKDLGAFIEIELMAENKNDLEAITQRMHAHLLPLSLKPLTTGYSTLILRKHNFEQYMQSRFIMEEDKVHLV